MAAELAVWEHQLLSWAHEARTSPALEMSVKAEAEILDRAYDYCRDITRTYSRTFYMASMLLPEEKRRAAQALYAFCRSTDDLIDELPDTAARENTLASWHTRLSASHPSAHDPIPLAWADTQARYRIPRGYADQLIAGTARDLTQKRYATFSELTEYCYGVASTVGLMTMYIIGFENYDAVAYAVKLGIALQITNILRDVGADWRAGRLYLPQDELAAFGLSEGDIAVGRVDDRWRAFMRFQIARAHRLYEEAELGIAYLNRDGRFAIAAAAELYRAILNDIEANDYDVFGRRAHVGLWGKLRRLPGIWWTSETMPFISEPTTQQGSLHV